MADDFSEKVTADVSEFLEAMSKASEAVNVFTESIKSGNANSVSSFLQMVTACSTAVTAIIELGEKAYEAAEKVYEFAKSGADAAENIEQMGHKLGLSTDQIQELSPLMSRSNLDIGNLTMAFRTLSTQMVAARTETGTAGASFLALGGQSLLTAAQSGDMQKTFLGVIDALSKMADGDQKAAYAREFLGRMGIGLIPITEGGTKAVNDAARAAHEYSAVLADEQIEVMGELAKKFHDLEDTALPGLNRQFQSLVAEGMSEVLDSVLHMIAAVAQWVAGPGRDWGVQLMATGKAFLELAALIIGPFMTVIGYAFKGLFDFSVWLSTNLLGGAEMQLVRIITLFKELQAVVVAFFNGSLFSSDGRAALMQEMGSIDDEGTARLQGIRDRLANLGNPPEMHEPKKDSRTRGTPPVSDALVKDQEKLSQAYEKQAEALSKLAQARNKSNEAWITEREKLSQAFDNQNKEQMALEGTVTGTSERNLADIELQRMQADIEERKRLTAEDGQIRRDEINAKIKLSQDKTNAEAGLLDKQGKSKQATIRRETGDAEVTGLQANRDQVDVETAAKVRALNVESQLATMQHDTGEKKIQMGLILAKQEDDKARISTDHANELASIQQRQQDGEITVAEATKRRGDAEIEMNARLIENKRASLATQTVGDVAYEKNRMELARMEDEQETRIKLNAQSVTHAMTEQDLNEAVKVAQSKEAITKTTFASFEDQQKAHVAVLKAEYDRDLQYFQGTEQEKVAYKAQKLAEIAEAERLASGNFATMYLYGLQKYSTDTTSTFNIAIDAARTTAQAMASGFKTFFFDIMNNNIKSFKDMFVAFKNFMMDLVGQIISQLMQIYVVEKVVGLAKTWLAGPSDGGLAWSESDAMTPTTANKGAFIQPKRFSLGGPVFSNNDSVPAMLTPGEGVLSRTGMANLEALNNGNFGGVGNLTVNIVNSGRDTKPDVNVERKFGEMVVNVIFKEIRTNGPLAGALRGL